jgi:hypothetical protein
MASVQAGSGASGSRRARRRINGKTVRLRKGNFVIR